jgi:hypothetical protein
MNLTIQALDGVNKLLRGLSVVTAECGLDETIRKLNLFLKRYGYQVTKIEEN